MYDGTHRFMWFQALPSGRTSHLSLNDDRDGQGNSARAILIDPDLALPDLRLGGGPGSDEAADDQHDFVFPADNGEGEDDDDDDDDEEDEVGDVESEGEAESFAGAGLRGGVEGRGVGGYAPQAAFGSMQGAAEQAGRSRAAAPVKRVPLLQYFASTGNRAVNIPASGSFKYVFVKATDLEDKSALIVQGCSVGGEFATC
jgi:hypothetical protein